MQRGDFVYIDYVGRIKETGEVFDLTKEEIAKKEGIYDPKFRYRPIPVIVGSNLLIRGLNKALEEMKVGEKKKVEIKPSDAFGERKEELVKIIPESVFKERNIEPVPGYLVTVSGLRGRILSVSGGRVKVDFNHPLAGKTLEYEIEIVKQIEEKEEKVKAIVCYFTGIDEEEVNASVKDEEVEISFKNKPELTIRAKDIISRTIFKWIEGVKKVKFIDEFEKEA